MKYIGVQNTYAKELSISSLGFENDIADAHWGPGIREGYILHYVLEGKGYFNNMPVAKGQGFFIESGKLHEYHPDANEPWKYFWLIVRGEHTAVHNCLSEVGITPHNHVFDIPFFPEFLKLTKELSDKVSSTISSTMALSFFYTLMELHRSRHSEKNRVSVPEVHIQDAILYMQNNYHTAIKITDVARHICVDDQYLYNLFTTRMGTSPKQFLNNLRVERACRFLKETSLSVSDIGDSVGYSDSLAFSAFFKRQVGISPSMYRQQSKDIALLP